METESFNVQLVFHEKERLLLHYLDHIRIMLDIPTMITIIRRISLFRNIHLRPLLVEMGKVLSRRRRGSARISLMSHHVPLLNLIENAPPEWTS